MMAKSPHRCVAADRMAADEALSNELKSALTYPMILAGAGGAIIFGMFVFVIPRFGALIDRSGADIPAVSRWVIDTSVWVKAHWYLALAGLVAAGAAVRFVLRHNSHAILAALLHVPAIGTVLRKADLETWARTLGVALANGSQLLPALDLAAETVRSGDLAAQLEGVRRDVRAGADLDDAFATNVLTADPMLLDLMATGRKSGTLDRMLVLAADTGRDSRRLEHCWPTGCGCCLGDDEPLRLQHLKSERVGSWLDSGGSSSARERAACGMIRGRRGIRSWRS